MTSTTLFDQPLLIFVFDILVAGPDCHLCLANYQIRNRLGCSNISPLHATVFYDEWSRHFELLNYSEFGSFVDAIPFKNDAIEKEVYQCKVRSAYESCQLLLAIY